MKKLAAILLIALPVFGPVQAAAQAKTVDCYCTNKSGARLELGEMTCIAVDGRMFMAQCQMSLNVPMWREISDGCLSSALPQSLQPTLDTGSVDPQI